MNTVGVDTSLTGFSPASAPSSKSRSTIAQLYGVDTHAAHGSRAIRWKMVAWQQAVWRASGFVPTVADMAARIDGLRATHEWLVLEREIRSSDLRTGSR
jgi:hypothetical protein